MRLLSGGIIANYQCPAACGHCLYGCSPSAQPGYMDEATAIKLCAHLRRLGCRSIHIGGGEPFLNIDGLIILIKAIIDSGLQIDYIETNAAWISGDNERNKQILWDVVNAGGDYIMVSADPFHIEFIPFWKPDTLIRLLKEMHISYFVWQDRYLPMLRKLDPQKKYDGQALQQGLGKNVIDKCALEYGMSYNGRALNLARRLGKKKALNELTGTGPCMELRNTSHFHVDFLERYIPPGCTGMGILMEDVGGELDPTQYPVMSKLMSGGITALLEYVQELGYRPNPDGYVSKCELCFDIRKYLIGYDRKAHPDLTPESFYQQNF